MSDAAAFFASKKKKKFKKFNANLVDATTLSSKVHVDAPALSNDQAPEAPIEVETPVEDRTKNVEVRALKLSSEAPPDIVQKVQREETKAKLAAAREGMERQAQQQQQKPAPAPAPASRWMSHRRKQETTFDVANTELFPDLAVAADKMSLSQPKPKIAPRPKKAKPAKPPMKKAAELKTEESKPTAPDAAPKPVAAPVAAATTAAKPDMGVVKKKKKKKDMSNFKPGSV